MNCPQCGKEMRPGFLQGADKLVFNQKQYHVSIAPRKEGDVEIVWNLVAGADFQGYICTDCRLVVFDYENPIDRWL